MVLIIWVICQILGFSIERKKDTDRQGSVGQHSVDREKGTEQREREERRADRQSTTASLNMER